MNRRIFIALQIWIVATTLFVAADRELLDSRLSVWLFDTLPRGLAFGLGDLGLPILGNGGGGAVCPFVYRGAMMAALSVLAIALGTRHLVKQFSASTKEAPAAFGPIECLLAAAGLLLLILKFVASSLPVEGLPVAILELYVRTITFNLVTGVRELAHILLAVSFWLTEIKLFARHFNKRSGQHAAGSQET